MWTCTPPGALWQYFCFQHRPQTRHPCCNVSLYGVVNMCILSMQRVCISISRAVTVTTLQEALCCPTVKLETEELGDRRQILMKEGEWASQGFRMKIKIRVGVQPL